MLRRAERQLERLRRELSDAMERLNRNGQQPQQASEALQRAAEQLLVCVSHGAGILDVDMAWRGGGWLAASRS